MTRGGTAPTGAGPTVDEGVPAGGPGAAISLPTGGGAIRGIGEKFAAQPVTGTGTVTVPLAVSAGRAGFGPSLALTYDSGSSNGPFGLGWSLTLPSISRKTDRGLPRYGSEPQDTYVLSGAEDLVPVLERCAGEWRRSPARRVANGRRYEVQRYRPRVESMFARIEQWTDVGSGDTHWRSITPDNVTTLYGDSQQSRIADPNDPSRVFRWLVCASYDDRGNATRYEYKAENDELVDAGQTHERNRTTVGRSANRYLKQVRYGNRVSRLVEPDLSRADWHFEVVLDYGEHDPDDPTPGEVAPWACRQDPFSSYRAGFEVRTYRLCQRVLMFHHFPAEEGVGRDCLVRSTDLGYRPGPVATFLESATQSGYRRGRDDGYLKGSMPPVEFTYTEAVIDDRLQEADAATLENLPVGLAGPAYRWVDLDGEGLSGVLTEQGDAWFYKANAGDGRFGPLQLVPTRPAGGLTGGRTQLLDLAGDGRLDVVQLDGPTPGFAERTDGQWQPLRPFGSRPTVSPENANLRFVDLTGDGHADVLITEDDVFTWYPSLAEDGFAEGRRAYHALDEEQGPRLVLADGTQSIHLADMSGDGLVDLVRIRNGETCYWPNLGYGRFGSRVTMDDAPWLDEPDLFDQRRIRVADIDGSGATDLVYLGRDGTHIYANRSGNGWGSARTLTYAFPRIDNVSEVTTADLLGNGTACLVWSSPLPSAAGRQLRYVDLMGGRKPHLLTSVRNNLGAETRIRYAPSTRFYLADKAAGRPWITRLPFPVHVVERVETYDHISGNRFVTRYAYHHGYFDGAEREFRGFALVEQWDTEAIAALDGTATNIDAATYVPPVLTRTWFHTGAFLDGHHISRQLADEYYREADHCTADPEELLLPDTVLPAGLSIDDMRQACRALKGSVLRSEVYALDGSEAERRPYTVSERNYTVLPLQPASAGHAVFVVHPRETITAHYERALHAVEGTTRADPRVSHELVLAVDPYGNVLRSVSIGYGRRHADPELTPRDQDVQQRRHVVCTEKRYSNAVEHPSAYRTPQLVETRTDEILGLEPVRSRPGSTNLFGFEEVVRQLDAVDLDVPVEQWDADPVNLGQPGRRLVELVRVVFRRDDLSGPLPLGDLEPLALPYESRRLAFTPSLLASLYGDRANSADLRDVGGFVQDGVGWWIPSGRVFYSADASDDAAAELANARQHFFVPGRTRDPYGEATTTTYDPYDLLVVSTRDPVGNLVSSGERDEAGQLVSNGNDYRVLRPRIVTDANGNRSEVAFDALGMVAGTAVMGKPEEPLGDSLDAFDPDPDESHVEAYLRDPLADPHLLLQGATTRLVHDLWAYRRTRHTDAPQPAVVAAMARETHAADLEDGEQSRVQHSFSYSDGFEREIQKKAQAEPGPLVPDGSAVSPRWVGTGWTIVNNKGKPVRQYEPFFGATHRFEAPVATGVSSVLFYDPVGRAVATVHPNGTWEKVTFGPWHQHAWDVNDTVLLDPATDPDVAGYVGPWLDATGGWQGWYHARVGGELGPAERAAASKAAAHAATPARIHLDSLGRNAVSVAHNRTDADDTLLTTRVAHDVEGNERAVADAKGRVVMEYGYDLLGGRVAVTSMDAGERLHLSDVSGRPMLSWNSRGFGTRIEYDALRRPVRTCVYDPSLGRELVVDRTEYGEDRPDGVRLNLRTRVFRQYDCAGVATTEAYDVEGNALRSTRQLSAAYREVLDWATDVPLEAEVFTSRTTFDALGRPVRLTAPDGSVVEPAYNEANLLERLEARLRGTEEVSAFVTAMTYNARGQRLLCAFGNGTRTEYEYDPLTFRLSRLRTVRGLVRLQDVRYTYDPAGNITHLEDDARQRVFFRNRRVEPDADFTYDATYRLVAATGREHLGQVDAAGPAAPGMDDEQRTRLAHPNDGAAMARYVQRYGYDEVGNLLRLVHRGDSPGSPGWTRTYSYDEPSGLETGQVSNRLSQTADGDGPPQPYTYDSHGNTLAMPGLPVMTWDYADRLQATARESARHGSTSRTTYYVYDSAGRRVRTVTDRRAVAGKEPTRASERIYLGGFEVHRRYRRDGDVRLARETLHIQDGQQRIAIVETRTAGNDDGPALLERFQVVNHLGSAALELDRAARVISSEEFHPYGTTAYQAVRSQTEAPKRYRYTGKERDEETGLYAFGARYYAPWLGRWTSPDPATHARGASGGRVDQPYVYVENRPVIANDPDGKIIWFVVIGAVALTSLTVVSPANAPTSATDPTYESISDGEFAGHAAVNAASFLVGGGVLKGLTGFTRSRVLAGAGGGLAAGAFGAPSNLAVSDIARDEASSVSDYLETTAKGALFGLALGGVFGGVSRLLKGPLPRPTGGGTSSSGGGTAGGGDPVTPPTGSPPAVAPTSGGFPPAPRPNAPTRLTPPADPPATLGPPPAAAPPATTGPPLGPPAPATPPVPAAPPAGVPSGPLYRIGEGVRRSVAAREAGHTDIAARISGRPDVVRIPLRQLMSPKDAIARDPRFLKVQEGVLTNDPNLPPIEVSPLNPSSPHNLVPLWVVKLLRWRP